MTEREDRKKFCFFWKTGPFSQWHASTFVGVSKFDKDEEQRKFISCEQWMMFNKALLFGDRVVAEKIMKETNQRRIKSLGREVKSFKEREWVKHRETIVYDGNYLKFTQVELLKDVLLGTHPKTLVEASPQDKIWGIGMREDNKFATNPQKWKGLNLLGHILTTLREDFRNEINKGEVEKLEENEIDESGHVEP